MQRSCDELVRDKRCYRRPLRSARWVVIWDILSEAGDTNYWNWSLKENFVESGLQVGDVTLQCSSEEINIRSAASKSYVMWIAIKTYLWTRMLCLFFLFSYLADFFDIFLKISTVFSLFNLFLLINFSIA